MSGTNITVDEIQNHVMLIYIFNCNRSFELCSPPRLYTEHETQIYMRW